MIDIGLKYNTYAGSEGFAYSIIKHLFNNETIWRLIGYDGADALSKDKSDLTQEQKSALIWTGQENSQDFRVFQQRQTDDSFQDTATQLRVYESRTVPVDRVKGIVLMNVDIIVHSKNNGLENIEYTRLSKLKAEIIKELNGKNIKGVGNLFFDIQGHRETGSKGGLANNKNFFGHCITFGTYVAGD